MKIKYFADDGKEFESENECLEYEAAQWSALISGGDPTAKAAIEAAAAYHPDFRALSAALEHAGNLCAAARRKAGDYKRSPPKKDEPGAKAAE